MAYLSDERLRNMGFKSLGHNVLISDKASLYETEKMVVGDNSRIDDFCVVSGNVTIGKYVHITPMCLVAGGEPGVVLQDFSTLAYGVKVFAQSDDYSGYSLVNSLVPDEYKNEMRLPCVLERHVVVGTNSVIFPGVRVAEGCAIGSTTLVLKSTKPWGIYVGSPARRIKERKKNLLSLEREFLAVLEK